MRTPSWIHLTLVAGSLLLPSYVASGQEQPPKPEDKTVVFDVGSFVLVMVEGSKRFLSYGAGDGQWDRHEFPAEVTAKPVISSDRTVFGQRISLATACFYLDGEAIEELVAVDSTGRFRKHPLDKPVRGPITCVLNGGLVYCVTKGQIHAFSTTAGTWGSIDAPSLEQPKLDGLTIHQPKGLLAFEETLVLKAEKEISIFSLPTGKWSTEPLAKP